MDPKLNAVYASKIIQEQNLSRMTHPSDRELPKHACVLTIYHLESLIKPYRGTNHSRNAAGGDK